MSSPRSDIITPEQAKSLDGLFLERVRRAPDATAYRHFDVGSRSWHDTSWQDMATEVGRWQQGLQRERLTAGDKVAVMLRNCREWVVFDQAALGLGLVTVPLYADDRPDNVAHILEEAEVKLLLVEGREQWRRLEQVASGRHGKLKRILSLKSVDPKDQPKDRRLESLNEWLFGLDGEPHERDSDGSELASLVYTSGTTGRPKGVMLSHRNMLTNAFAATQCGSFLHGDIFLSFLPLSHTLERTIGYYLPIMIGATVAYARSVPQLADDLVTIRPTVLISVPRIYERVYGKIQSGLQKKGLLARALFQLTEQVGWARFQHAQGRARWRPSLLLWPLLERLVATPILARLGGRLRYSICGGAPLAPRVAKTFLSMGMPLLQGYGLTEASPVVSVNRPEDNIPASIGTTLPGIEVRIGDQEELLTRSDCVMQGYWKNREASAKSIDQEGWLHTGDQARIDEQGHLYIIGRLKDILVLANGEKVPPADMELAIALDPLFEQVMVVGEGKPFLTVLAVLNQEQWQRMQDESNEAADAEQLKDRFIEKMLLRRISKQLHDFPGYAQVRRGAFLLKPWQVEEGLLTPTLKLRRNRILAAHAEEIDRLYEGHQG